MLQGTSATNALFQISSTKLYVAVVTLYINDNITFLGNLRLGFKRTISWNKYRSEVTTQLKNNNLDYLIDPTFRNINRLFFHSFNFNANDNDDFPERNWFGKYYMLLAEILV